MTPHQYDGLMIALCFSFIVVLSLISAIGYAILAAIEDLKHSLKETP